MEAVIIKCLQCGADEDFKKYRLQEGALLICPNCGAEFSLTATLEQLPGEDGTGVDDFGMEEPEPELPDLPSPSAPAPSAPETPELPVAASAQPSKRQPVIEVHVLACNECNASWIGTHATACPNCQSKAVMRTDRTIQDRAEEAVAEVERGVPVERVLAKMTGKFRTALPRRRRVQHGRA